MARAKKKPPAKRWNAQDLLDLVARKHGDDVFVHECKTGPSWTGQHLRMDAWAMNRSWAKACVWAYEIKVSRSDFTSDNKWHGAFACCNQFYFVCPPGLIKPEELPDEAGLYWASINGKKLMTKKRAKHRPDVQFPESLWRYLLMCRTRVVEPGYYEEKKGADYWRDWLAKKEEDRILGYKVSRALAAKYRNDVDEVQRTQGFLEAKVRGLEGVQALCNELGLSDYDRISGWRLKSRLEEALAEARNVVPEELIIGMERMGKSVTSLAGDLKAFNKGEEKGR